MRTYSEQEVADIIARAAERQAASSRTSDRVGLTLDEIARLGSDAGLDPDDLRAAAEEIDRGGIARQTSQTDTHVVAERWVDALLTDEAVEDAVTLLRERAVPGAALLGESGGSLKQVGRAVEWASVNGLGVQTTATLSPRGDRTRIRITQLVGTAKPKSEGLAYGGLLGGLFAAIAAVVLGKTLGLAAPIVILATLAVFAVTMAVSAPTITAFDRRWRSRRLAALDTLADDLAGIIVAPAHSAVRDAPLPDAPLRDTFEALGPDEEVEDARDMTPRRQDRA